MKSWESNRPVNVILTEGQNTYVNKWSSPDEGTKFTVVRQSTGDHKKPNALEFNKRSHRCLRGTAVLKPGKDGWDSHNGGVTTTHFGSHIEFDPPFSSSFTAVYNDAVAQISEGLRGNIDLTIDGFQLGPLRKTLNDLTHGFRTLHQSYKRIERQTRRGTSDDGINQAIKEFGSFYLQWWYGIRPTIMTAQELAEKLHTALETATCTKSFKVRAKRNIVTSVAGKAGIFPTDSVSFSYRARIETTYRCEIGVTCKTSLSKIQQISQFVSLNPAAWAYELTPWSFVLDWFWNFGGYMRSLETAITYADLFVSGYCTYTGKRLVSIGKVSTSDTRYTWKQGEGGTADVRYFKRTVLSRLPAPRVPTFDPRLGSKRMLALAALLSQGLGRKLPLANFTKHFSGPAPFKQKWNQIFNP